MAKNKYELQQEKRHIKALVEIKGIQECENISSKDLELINQNTRKELTAEEVYIYPIILTSNDESIKVATDAELISQGR